MDKRLMERLAALKAKASADPKNIDGIVDAVSEDDAFIQKVVEKIMSKMDAQDGAGKYKVDAHGTNKKQAAYDRVLSLVKSAFDMPGAAPAPAPAAPAPAPAAPSMSPMDPLFGETPGAEAAEASVPQLAPVQQLEDQAKSYGDPALDALVNVIELLIKKDMGGDLPPAAAPAGPAAPMADDLGAGAPPFPPAGDDAGGVDVLGEEAPLGDDAGAGAGAGAPPFGGGGDDKPKAEKSEGGESKPKSDDKGGEKKSDDKSGDDKPAEKKDDDKGGDDEKKSVEARLRSLVSLPKAERLARAAQLRQLAEVAESGELPAFMKKDEEDDEKMDKEAIKSVLRAALAALEAGENDKKYTEGKTPQEHVDKAEELEKEASLDRKAKVLAHLNKLRIQKEATVDGKSMATPKEVPSPEGTVEDNLKGDAPVQYSNALGEVNLGEIQTKKQKLPSDKSHGDEAEMYAGNNPEAHTEIQSEKDSSKGINNKRVQKDMATNSISSEPHNPTEMSSDKGSHQKEKDWETAKNESDKTPSGGRLVGLASETNRTKRAVKLARAAQAKGIIATDDQYDELVEKYASYDDVKFAMAAELIDDTPARKASAPRTVKAQEAVFEDNEAVEDAEEEPKSKREASLLESAKSKVAALGIKPAAGGITKYITTVSDGGSVRGVRPPMPHVTNERFASLADPDVFNWKGVTTAFLEAERNGSLDEKGQRPNAEL